MDQFDQYISMVGDQCGGEIRSSFSIEVQKRIALDVWLYLLTPQGKPNWEFLWFYSYALALFKFANDPPEVKKMSGYLAHMWTADAAETAETLAEMGRETYPPFCRLSEVANRCLSVSVGTLLRLPYFEHLRRQQSETKSKANSA